MVNVRPRLTRLHALLAAAIAGLLALTLVPRHAEAASSPDDSANVEAKIRHVMHGMSLNEKVGQLFMTYAYGDSATTRDDAAVRRNQQTYGVDNAQQLIDKYHLGGIIYFTWSDNLKNPEQIARLSNGIQRAAEQQPSSIPMLIATDQEQGIVTRVGPPAVQFPGNMALGAGRSTDDTRTAARITGEELRAVGINQNFAPVADVNVNAQNPVIGVRSFGSKPEMVAEMTGAAVRGYQEANVAATAKHFPGHGDTNVDSHTGLPVIDHTREEWRRIDRPPFQAAIEQGVDAIMTAHIVVPSLDPSGDPATLSKPIINGILRQEMHYDGVVVTDALTMAGVREKYGDADVPVRAIKAGVDMLLMPPPGKLDLQYNAVLDAVRSGEIKKQRLNEAVSRILRLKFERGLFTDPYADVDKVDQRVGTPEHQATAQRISDRTPTLIKNAGGLLPLKTGSGKNVLITGWGSSTTATLADKIAARGVQTDRLYTGSPTDEEIDAAVAAAENHDLTVVTTSNAWEDAQQQKLVRRLVDTGTPIVALSVRAPYDIAYFPDVSANLATYSYKEVALESATRVLFGEVAPTGKLPVMVPGAQDPGQELYPYGFGLTYG